MPRFHGKHQAPHNSRLALSIDDEYFFYDSVKCVARPQKPKDSTKTLVLYWCVTMPYTVGNCKKRRSHHHRFFLRSIGISNRIRPLPRAAIVTHHTRRRSKHPSQGYNQVQCLGVVDPLRRVAHASAGKTAGRWIEHGGQKDKRPTGRGALTAT